MIPVFRDGHVKSSISIVLFVSLVLLSQIGHGQDEFSNTIFKRIETAKVALESTSIAINKEKRDYAERLSHAESDVQRLREQAAGIQRDADEKLVSLQKLQDRLNQWQDQQAYQSHLLQRHAELVLEDSDDLRTGADGVDVLDWSLERMEKVLSPRWETVGVAMPSGEFVAAQVIRFGPARWFFADQIDASGLYEVVPGQHLQSYYGFSGAAHEQLQHLVSHGSGSVIFDPTQGRAIEIARHKETFWEHIQKGGLWILPIIFFGATALLIALLKSVQLAKLPRPSARTLEKLEELVADNSQQARALAIKLFEGQHNAYKRIVATVLQHPPSQKRDDMLFSIIAEQRARVDKYLDVISLTAAVAPLLGLLGTVSGMIKTFKMLTIFGSGDPAAVSGGISEALVTTELGLIVAIPALVVSAFLSRKAKAYMHNMEETAITLSSR